MSAALTLLVHSTANAHAMLLSSEPAAGSILAASPSRIRLLFSEAIEPSLSAIAIVGGDGRTIPLTVGGDPHDVHALVAPLSVLSAGEYRVAWHVVSADGHPVGGSYLFSVGHGGAPPPDAVAPPATTWGPTILGAPLVPALLRGLGVGAIAAVAGLLFFIVWMGAGLGTRPARLALWLAVAAPLLLGAHFGAWLLNASPDHRVDAAWLSTAVESAVGRAELWRTLLAIPPLWALALARRPGLALGLAILPLLASAAVGHSAALHPMLAVPSKALHLAAMAAWIGGLLWLVARERTDAGTFAVEASRVSTVALTAVVVVTLSGVAQTLLLVPLHDLVSAYGAIVAAKVAGLGVLVAFGAHHRYRMLPRITVSPDAPHPTDAFRASLAREIAIVGLVVLLGGLLAYVSPPAVAGGSRPTAIPESPE